MVKISKEKRGSSDVVTDVSSNINAVRLKDIQVVRFRSLLVNNQFSRPSVIVIVEN